MTQTKINKNINKKRFLFLQSPNSHFFRKLGYALVQGDHKIKKINFCGGDNFFWKDKYCINFTDKIDNWKSFLINLHTQENFTDIILYGDCRQYHKIAIKLFKENYSDVKIHVFEEGYFRPNWVTYERDGVNNNSSLPNNKEFYDALKEEEFSDKNFNYKSLKSSFRHKAFYTCMHYIYRSFYDEENFPNYVPHRKTSPEEEGGAWFRKGMKTPFRRLNAKFKQYKILKNHKKFFLLALQLCSDSQITDHSNFSGMREAIEIIIKNFSENAPKKYSLIVKSHPEETGISKLHKKTITIAKKYNIEDRVIFINGGNMPKFLRIMKGMVTINSTATLSAIHHNKAVKCLGRAFYNFEGLTDQQKLEDFWNSPKKPDISTFGKFKFYIHDKSQLNGNFYSAEGIDLLVNKLVKKLTSSI